jgi:hypothetical protein
MRSVDSSSCCRHDSGVLYKEEAVRRISARLSLLGGYRNGSQRFATQDGGHAPTAVVGLLACFCLPRSRSAPAELCVVVVCCLSPVVSSYL